MGVQWISMGISMDFPRWRWRLRRWKPSPCQIAVDGRLLNMLGRASAGIPALGSVAFENWLVMWDDPAKGMVANSKWLPHPHPNWAPMATSGKLGGFGTVRPVGSLKQGGFFVRGPLYTWSLKHQKWSMGGVSQQFRWFHQSSLGSVKEICQKLSTWMPQKRHEYGLSKE